MGKVTYTFGALGVLWVLAGACFLLSVLGISIYGIYLAFSASVILGVVCLLVEPSPLVFGAVMLIANKNVPQMVVDWLNK